MKSLLKYLFIFMGCMFVSPLVSHAECSYERTAELSRIASNVQFSYNYDVGAGNNISFYITANNITNDIYVQDEYNHTFTAGEWTERYPYGITTRFDIYSNDGSCRGEKILTQYVTLPSYNHFHNSEECSKYPNFTYCKLWLNTSNITKDDFDKKLTEYQAQENANNITDEKEATIWEIILSALKEYYYVPIAIVILVLSIIWYKRK